MKITIFLKIINIFLSAGYIYIISTTNLIDAWFSVSLIFISISLLVRSICFVQDSKLWFGSFLLFVGIFGIFTYFYNLPFKLTYPIYILIFGFSSFLVFAIFRQNIHLKVFVLCFFEVLLLSIYKFAYLTLLEFCILQTFYLLFVISKLFVRAKINTRSN